MRLTPLQFLLGQISCKSPYCRLKQISICLRLDVDSFAVSYGLERINAEVAAWMRGDILPGGKYAQPPFAAMGYALFLSLSSMILPFLGLHMISCQNSTSTFFEL